MSGRGRGRRPAASKIVAEPKTDNTTDITNAAPEKPAKKTSK